MSDEKTSFVLYPHGPPRLDVGRTACTAIVEYICGNIAQTREGPFASHDAQLKTIAELLRVTDEATNRGVIVLTELSDLPLGVIRLRRDISNAHPRLFQMLWIVFVEQNEHPFFEQASAQLGRFDAQLNEVPVWITEGLKWLVLTPESERVLAKQRARTVVPSSGYFKATRPEGIPRPDLGEGFSSPRSRPRR